MYKFDQSKKNNIMKSITKLLAVCTIVLMSTNLFAEVGMNMSNLNLYAPAAKSKGSSSGGGIEKGDMQLDVAFNLGSHGALAGKGGFYRGAGVGFVPGVTINFDYAVHKYASVGGYVGFGGRYKAIHIAAGARGVFHIYQLIADKASTKVDPGKLDFYFPFHIGAVVVKPSGYKAYAGASFGGGLGVRYYFTDMVGVMGEVGWLEMSVFKVGAAFRF